MEHPNHLPTSREPDAILQLADVSLPAVWSSRRTLKNIKAYGALMEEYRRLLVAVRHFNVELEKLRDLPAHTRAERLAVQVRIARHEQELAATQEEAEIARLERALKKVQLERQLAEHTPPTSMTADGFIEMQAIAREIVAAVKASGVADDSPLLAAVRAQLCERIIRMLT
jgi:predicted  nucleic acid-binding Zn-ribbon protein